MSEKVNKALRGLISRTVTRQVITGTVAEVDENNFTVSVDPSDGGARFHDVRLRSVINDDDIGFIVIPELKANVIIGMIGNNENANHLISTDKIRKLIVKTGTGTKAVFGSGGSIEFNGGNNGGLTITPTLKAELAKTTALLDAIKNLLLTWSPVSQDGGAALKLAAGAVLQSLQSGNFSQIENQKVKH